MAEEALLKDQVTYLYQASAKELYSLALYSIGDQTLAERITADAFVFAFDRQTDKTDVTGFRIKSVRRLYRIGKKNQIKRMESQDARWDRIHLLLTGLKYDERFLLLLFLWGKFSRQQIAQILGVPEFILKKRIHKLLRKAKQEWSRT